MLQGLAAKQFKNVPMDSIRPSSEMSRMSHREGKFEVQHGQAPIMTSCAQAKWLPRSLIQLKVS